MVYIIKLGTYGNTFIGFDNKGYQNFSELLAVWQENHTKILDKKSLEILKYISYNNFASIYGCFKFMNVNQKIKISYKNVHRKVHNLLELGLITKKDESDKEIEKHGAIYYRLSQYGIFYVLNKRLTRDILEINLAVLHNHRNFFIFKYLLYPHMSYQTVEKITSHTMMVALETYLYDCTVVIESMFLHLSSSLLFSIQKLGGLIYTNDFLIQSIFEDLSMGRPLMRISSNQDKNKKEYQISEIISKDKEKMIRLSTDEKDLYFKLKNSKLQAYENNEDNFILEIDIDTSKDKDLLSLVKSYTQINSNELYDSYFKQYYRYDIYTSLVKILTGVISAGRLFAGRDANTKDALYDDLLLLRNDNNFMSAMFTIKSTIDEDFSIFENLD